MWTRQIDGYRANWAGEFAEGVFAIRRDGRKFVLTLHSLPWGTGQEGNAHRLGEYNSVADAKAHAQKLKEES